MSPPGLDRAVTQCLAKDPDDRWQTAGDLRRELTWLAEGGSQAGVPAPLATRRKSRKRLAWTLAATGWVAALAIAAISWVIPSAPQPEGPFFAAIPPSPLSRPAPLLNVGPMALSPDGTQLAAVVWQSSDFMIAVYDFESGSSSVLESTKGAIFPFWSPEGRWIGFFADGKLRKVEASGGPAQVLADAFQGRGGSWNRDGLILFAPDIRGPLMTISENGGVPTAITELDSDDLTHRNPHFLPDGKRFLFIERGSSEAYGRLMAGSTDGTPPREVLDPASNVHFSAGHLLFVRERNLLAQRFDADALTLRGPIVPVAGSIDYWNGKDVGNFSATEAGLLVFRSESQTNTNPAWINRDGQLIEALDSWEQQYSMTVSRDFQQLALGRRESSGETFDIWGLDLATRQTQRMTFASMTSVVGCAFSPDGRRLAVSSLGGRNDTSQSSKLWIQPVSGTRNLEALAVDENFTVTDWSPDGQALLGWSQRTGTSLDITFVRLDDPESRIQDLLNSRFSEIGAKFSPDGAWVMYVSDESGSNEVYVVDFPNADRKWQVSRGGGRNPIWRQDGREIFFRSSGSVMVASVTRLEDGIEIGTPVSLGIAEAPRLLGSDGERFLVEQRDPAAALNPIGIIRDWPAILEREAR
jgi:Tol biopolymer transport system component